MIPRPPRCSFPTCTRTAEHQHHIVYYPEEVISPLCRAHHEEITMLNGIHGRRVRHTLSNKHRWWIWYQWREGSLRPRRTRKALAYIEEWDTKPNEPSIIVESPPPEPVEEAPKRIRRSASRKQKTKRNPKRRGHRTSAKKGRSRK